MGLGINTNLAALSAQNSLNRISDKQKTSLQKLSSGFQINSAKDNPAGLVISEYLRAQLSGLTQASQNSQEAYNTLAIAEGGLSETSSALTTMRSLAVASLNTGVTSPSQVSAYQSQLNGLVNTINNTAATTSYAGSQLLDGSKSINYSTDDPSQMINTSDTSITARGADSGEIDISFAGGAAAQAEKAYVESATVAGGNLTEDTEFTVTGENGSQTFSFAAGTALTDVADTINQASDSTGVTAYSVNGDTQLRLVSEDYGSDQSVQVEQTQGSLFAAQGQTAYDAGQDAQVSVGGAQYTTDGLELTTQTGSFSGTVAFNEGSTASTTIAQTGYDQDTLTNADTAASATLENFSGGMQFQLGEGSASSNRDIFGINAASSSTLGKVEIDGVTYTLNDLTSGGSASLANNPEAALAVIDQAIADVSAQRASIGAYQANSLQTNINSLSVAIENVTATESSISATDYAKALTESTLLQVQQQAAVSVMKNANLNAENVMKLLGA